MTLTLPRPLILLLSTGLFFASTIIQATADHKELQQLLKQLDAIQNKHNIPAYSVIISDANKTLLNEIRGVNKLGDSQPVKQKAYFRIGSITKTFIGLSAVIAEQKDQLKLTDSIDQLVDASSLLNLNRSKSEVLKSPWFRQFKLSETTVTLEQLLEHTAGLQDMSREEFDSNVELSLNQATEKFSKYRVIKWPPGQHHSYSNAGYGLAGQVIEVAVEKNISQWLQESIFNPLAMTSATLQLNTQVERNLVPGYQADGTERIPYWHMAYSSLGAINIQPSDMAKLIRMFLANGTPILDPDSFARFESPKTTLASRAGMKFGYGLGIYQWQRGGHSFYGHGGDADGYLSKFAYQKDAKLGYFIVINTFNGRALRAMERAIENLIIKNLKTRKPQPSVDSDKPSEFAGEYIPVTARFGNIDAKSSLFIKWDGKQLNASTNRSRWYPLVHLGDGLFRYQNQSVATVAIVQDNGKIWLQSDDGNFVKTIPSG